MFERLTARFRIIKSRSGIGENIAAQYGIRRRFRQIHDGHATYLVPDEKVFVTPEAIRAVALVGSAEEIISEVREIEKLGFREINIMPSADHCREAFTDFAKEILPAFKN